MIPSVFYENRIKNETERYLLTTYLLVVLLSSVIGDSFILLASVRRGAIKLNKFIVAIMQHIAICDLLRSAGFVIPSIISLIADKWIMGDTMAWTYFFLNAVTFQVSNYLICALTTSKCLMLKFPEQTRNWNQRGAHIACIVLGLGSLIFLVFGISYSHQGIVFNYISYSFEFIVFKSNNSPLLIYVIVVPMIIPTSIIILTTFSTLCYLIESRKAAERSGGRLRWQGMVTVTVTAICYCISVAPFMISCLAGVLGGYQLPFWALRIASFLTSLNVMSNFYIYSLTIPSFRQFISSKVSTFCRSLMAMLYHNLRAMQRGSATEGERSVRASGVSI